MEELEKIDPNKFKSCKTFIWVPGGATICQIYCSMKQVCACFVKFWEEYDKKNLTYNN